MVTVGSATPTSPVKEFLYSEIRSVPKQERERIFGGGFGFVDDQRVVTGTGDHAFPSTLGTRAS